MNKSSLERYYVQEKKSAADIARVYTCSQRTINYWLKKYNIPKRSIREALYIKNNPHGDPFVIKNPKTKDELILFGMGLGLYWGEGTKASKNAIRLGNSDPLLMKKFMEFLETLFGVKKKDLKFQLQIFSDLCTCDVEKIWMEKLGIHKKQLYKTIVTPQRSPGTYRKKNKYGVVTLYYGNTKLRDVIYNLLPKE